MNPAVNRTVDHPIVRQIGQSSSNHSRNVKFVFTQIEAILNVTTAYTAYKIKRVSKVKMSLLSM